MRKIITILLSASFWYLPVCSQISGYSVSLIPDSLSMNANAVIRLSETDLMIIDSRNALLKVKEVTTVLNKSGIKHGQLYIPYSEKFEKIISITGVIYDQFGIEKSKIKKTDIYDAAKYDGFSLYTDARKRYIKAPLLDPPYTVEYEYIIELNGLYTLPEWIPVSDEKVSVEQSKFLLHIPNQIKFDTREFHGDEMVIDIQNVNGTITKTYSLNMFKAIEFESFNDNLTVYFPLVKYKLSELFFEGYAGRTDTWEDFGNWKYQLINGKDILPPETCIKILELIKPASNDYEKAKIIYEYMQKKTRYVNISEGIGGLQPVDATTVDMNGYGDCKALSNYTMSLLKAAGIKSYYTSVFAGEDFIELIKDFPTHQSNHIIICVPFDNDTIWLECTDQDIPFGYLGKFTDDRDVLMIDSNGKGKLAHTTVYPENVNLQNRNATIVIDEKGNVNVLSHTVYSGLQYDLIRDILNKSDIEKEMKLYEDIALPNIKINSFSYENIKNRIPSIIEQLDFTVLNYASVSSGRLFLVSNMLTQLDVVPPKIENRKTEIIFRRGYTDFDTLLYKIPMGYEVEYLPENISKNSKFGTYEVSYRLENSSLLYIRKMILHKGKFPPTDYEELRQFFKMICNSDKKAAVFKKV